MVIKIGNFDFSEVWDGVFYKKLSQYPIVSDWEMKNIIDFINYEKMNNRTCILESEDNTVLEKVKANLKNAQHYRNVKPPLKITECTECPYRKGCMTKFVCHTSPVENAINIFDTGRLLSAVKVRKLSANVLKQEKRNVANDPEDYFDYIMFAWGNCQAGDRLVMERKLKRFPSEEDLSTNFTPGVRFYFKYEEISKHPYAVFDGVLPLKVKNEVKLEDWIYAIIVPKSQRGVIENYISDELSDKVYYIENDCKDIWDWSEKVYCFVENLK